MSDFSTKALSAVSLHASEDAVAQQHFCEGLLWCYGFHHERALACFEAALAREPDCPLAHWGIAYAIGPFYNRPWSWFTSQQKHIACERGHNSLTQARQLIEQAESPATVSLQRQLIEALLVRYPSTCPDDYKNQDELLAKHAQAMLGLLPHYEQNLDVVTLTVEAMMNCAPWQLWNIKAAKPADNSHVIQCVNLLEAGLAQASESNIEHSGLLHYHVHALEMSPTPEKSLASVESLRTLDSPCGHLIHMATHIDILVGDYASAVSTNDAAIKLDQRIKKIPNEFYTISRLHNQHLKLYAAMMSGQKQAALDAQHGISNTVTPQDIDQPDGYLGISIEGFYANAQHVNIRFGEWPNIIETPAPANPELYLLTTAMHHYAQSVAHSALGNIQDSEQAAQAFQTAVSNIPPWHIINNNSTIETLRIADHMQRGERLFRLADFNAAFGELRIATRLADALEYCEPWAWMHPPRHALGALLLERNNVEEALEVYEIDLGINPLLPRALQHPDNIWALQGLHECLIKTGQDKRAHDIEGKLIKARAIADISVTSSCCCRRV